MKFIQQSISQLKSLLPIIALSVTPVVALLLCTAIIAVRADIPPEHFTRDPAAIFNGHPFTGVISNIGILLWCSTLAVCLFSSTIIYKLKNSETAFFLLFSGLFTAFLLFDDLLMLHESIFPKYLHIPEKLVYVGYLMGIVLYFIRFTKVILRTDYMLLLIACFFFAFSIGFDMVLPQSGWEYFLEDGLKLIGIFVWFLYFIRTCFIQFKLFTQTS